MIVALAHCSAQGHGPEPLIDRLPSVERRRLLSLCEPVDLVLAELLCEPGQPMRHVYFPTDGFISLVALGLKAAPLRAVVQGAGQALRVTSVAFGREVAHSRGLAYMLGARRVRVTVAASALQRRALITYHRGQLTVLNRAGLLTAACSCYASDRKVYAEGV